MFLLALPSVFAGNQSSLFNNATIIYHPSNNVSQDNSTYKATASLTSDPLFDISTNSTDFDGDDYLAFSTIPAYTTMLNYSFFFWGNLTGNDRVNMIIGNNGAGVNGEFRFFYNDAGASNQFTLTTFGGCEINFNYVTLAVTETNGYELYGFSVTKNSTTLNTGIIYINGTEVASGTCAADRGILTTSEIHLASEGTAGVSSQRYIGVMKGVIFINTTRERNITTSNKRDKHEISGK